MTSAVTSIPTLTDLTSIYNNYMKTLMNTEITAASSFREISKLVGLAAKLDNPEFYAAEGGVFNKISPELLCTILNTQPWIDSIKTHRDNKLIEIGKIVSTDNEKPLQDDRYRQIGIETVLGAEDNERLFISTTAYGISYGILLSSDSNGRVYIDGKKQEVKESGLLNHLMKIRGYYFNGKQNKLLKDYLASGIITEDKGFYSVAQEHSTREIENSGALDSLLTIFERHLSERIRFPDINYRQMAIDAYKEFEQLILPENQNVEQLNVLYNRIYSAHGPYHKKIMNLWATRPGFPENIMNIQGIPFSQLWYNEADGPGALDYMNEMRNRLIGILGIEDTFRENFSARPLDGTQNYAPDMQTGAAISDYTREEEPIPRARNKTIRNMNITLAFVATVAVAATCATWYFSQTP